MRKEKIMDEIKKCNCGGQGKLFIHTINDKIYYSIYCDKCGIQTLTSEKFSDTIKIWNEVMK